MVVGAPPIIAKTFRIKRKNQETKPKMKKKENHELPVMMLPDEVLLQQVVRKIEEQKCKCLKHI